MRLVGLGMRLDGLGMRLDGLGMRLDGQRTRLVGLGTRLVGLGTRLDGWKTRLDVLFGVLPRRFYSGGVLLYCLKNYSMYAIAGSVILTSRTTAIAWARLPSC